MTGSTPPPYWSSDITDLLARLGTSTAGLAADEARRRLEQDGTARRERTGAGRAVRLFLAQLKSPVTLLLLFAAGLSFLVHDRTDGLIIAAIVLVSAGLGFWQEWGAADAVAKLLAVVRVRATVRRDGIETEVDADAVVSGDIVRLRAGAAVPGDCRILDGKDLFVNEAALTGESYPVEKLPGVLAADTPLGDRSNALLLGSHVVSGEATAVVVSRGRETVFGGVAERLRLRPPETGFEHGVRRFGYLLLEITLVLVVAIFAINVYFARPVLDSFLFALALAVGLTPQLLPAVISVNLARGARRMADQKVIVKRLAAIENFGSMDVLCSDKTGTLTEGVARIETTVDAAGAASPAVFLYAYLNAVHVTSFANPIDDAIRRHGTPDITGWEKLDEVPYDFVRKRMSVLLRHGQETLLLTKGAVDSVVTACTTIQAGAGSVGPLAAQEGTISRMVKEFSSQGFRVLGVAVRPLTAATVTREDERDMTFAGLVAIADPIKAGVERTIRELNDDLGVSLKIITGDHHLVAEHVGHQLGYPDPQVLTGRDIRTLSDEALLARVGNVDLFAEVEPNQKERIILALRKAGRIVGFMGDGINDASALHAADVGISVNTAVDVAKEAADIVLLDPDLAVLAGGVRAGRVTFANTLKYVFMATSANFGNMFSMAGASLFLPFLPLLPKQILLTNLMTDFPEMTIAGDRVDPELQTTPQRWDVGFIRRFMLTFGIVSSVFDFLTFGVLLLVLHASPALFRTGWFVESVVSASLIVLVVRTRRPAFRTRPSTALILATALVVIATISLPYTPLASVMGFVPLPAALLWPLGVIVLLYLVAAEAVKRRFYRAHPTAQPAGPAGRVAAATA